MSTFQDSEYDWRDTYFVLFPAANRPSLEAVTERLRQMRTQYDVANPQANEEGLFEAMTIRSPDDFSALDVSFIDGEEVIEQRDALLEEFAAADPDELDPRQVRRLAECDARFDVMHFAQVMDDVEEDPDAMLDPSALLIVLEELARLTDGVSIDPQSGMVM